MGLGERTWRMHLDIQVGGQALRRGVWPRNGGCHHPVTLMWPIDHLGLPCPLEIQCCKSSKPLRWCLLLHLQHLHTCGLFAPHPPAMVSSLVCPKSTHTRHPELSWLHGRWGEGLGPCHSAAIFVYILFYFCPIPSTCFAPGSSVFFALCYKEQLGSSQLLSIEALQTQVLSRTRAFFSLRISLELQIATVSPISPDIWDPDISWDGHGPCSSEL